MRTRYRVLAEIRNDPRASYQELMERLGFKSKSVVAYHIEKLVEEGLIRKVPYLSRSLNVRGCPSQPLRNHRASTPSLPSPKLGRAPNLGKGEKRKIDQRKRNSARTCEKKQEAGKMGRGVGALANKSRTANRLKTAERIELVVAMAMAGSGDPSQTDMMLERRLNLRHATKIG